MLLTQIFKTSEGAQKRAAFETAHCGGRYHYRPVRCVDGEPDQAPFDLARFSTYNWRIERTTKGK